ncbi:MAG: PASTA domain-containing protein [Paludibacteraceae bacterium]|nr:PASTA domain-containing protein [Paludibacteraceae bacterium]
MVAKQGFQSKKNQGCMPVWKVVLINLCIAVGVGIALLIGLRLWLKQYTEHGVEVEVPQVTGLTYEEASILLEGSHLKLEVIDSTYSNKVPLGTIVEQSPVPVSHAKRGRTVYVVMNARQRRQVALPQLIDVSYRQAESTLRQIGLQSAGVVYEPSAYRDLVLDVRSLDSVSIEAGTLLTEGTAVLLVVGQGLGTEQVVVPELRGLHLQDARSLLLASHLTMGVYTYDEEPTEETLNQYVVYQQEPAAGSKLQEGKTVNIRLSTNVEKAAIVSTGDDTEEEFF